MSTVAALPDARALQAAAGRLVGSLRAHDDIEYRQSLLRRLVRRLGDDDYPLFIRLLCMVEECGDDEARATLAETFGIALRRADLPSGALSSWGAAALPGSQQTVSASAMSGRFFGAAPQRLLGPIEYLTVWSLQSTQRIELGAAAYRHALSRIISLMNCSALARDLYPQKLAADAQNQIEGAFSRSTRERLRTIADAWRAGCPPDEVARRAAPEQDGSSGHSQRWVVRDL